MNAKRYFLLVPFLIGDSQATIVWASNFRSGNEPETLPIYDSAGVALTEDFGQVWVGSYPDDKDFSNLTEIFDDFRFFGSAQPFSATFPHDGGIVNGTGFEEPSSGTSDLTSTQESVYVVIQRTKPGFADEFAVWRADTIFRPDEETGLEGISTAFIMTGSGELLVGRTISDATINVDGIGEVTYPNGIQLVIPEPSTGLFLGLAALGAASRRRR